MDVNIGLKFFKTESWDFFSITGQLNKDKSNSTRRACHAQSGGKQSKTESQDPTFFTEFSPMEKNKMFDDDDYIHLIFHSSTYF